ncbi:MAG: GHMP kinase [Deltaproteobacteria bacterium]|nr:GHMP kinase [Deltaproteobacteria bacterium]
MIISQTPLRISFAGGGSDFEGFYGHQRGAVLCTSIDKYIYVILKSRFDDQVRVGYSTTEIVDHIDSLRHELVRESMRTVGIHRGVEISTMADVPSTGSGLGSSSSVTVGLLNALHAYRGEIQTAATLARQAAEIEIDILGKPIGKQDQYAAAFGNFRKISFNPDDSVNVRTVELTAGIRRALDERLMLLYTGYGRNASDILVEQKANGTANSRVLARLVDMVDEMESCLLSGDLDEFGRFLHRSWELKRGLASKISNPHIDSLYERAMAAGALGGKIVGAGGGGFLLLYCNREKQDAVKDSLRELRELPFRFEMDGSKIIFNARR